MNGRDRNGTSFLFRNSVSYYMYLNELKDLEPYYCIKWCLKMSIYIGPVSDLLMEL